MNEINKFFDKMALNRNKKIASNIIVNYEQKMRSKTVISLLSPKENEKNS